MQRQTYTVVEMAQILGIGRSTAYEAVRSGRIPTIRLGRRFLVPKLAIESILAARTANATQTEDPRASIAMGSEGK